MSTHCDHCGILIPRRDKTVGYGKTPDGKIVCYACCALFDAQAMRDEGRITLYLSISDKIVHGHKCTVGTVTNWPGSLRFKAGRIKRGGHNLAGQRIDTWFIGPDEGGALTAVWHGVMYGDNTQLLHCKRTRQRTYHE